MKYIDDFIKIKELTENSWESIEINKKIYGYQIQKGTKWKKGLSENQIIEFEKIIGFKFPEILRDYYTIMNGVDKEQINVFGNSGQKVLFSQNIYGFPDDLQKMNDLIKWIYEENGINEKEMEEKNISKIFPIFYHRFMLIDNDKTPILSMFGNDIILYANNIIDLYNKDILLEEIEINNNMDINRWLD